MGSPRDNRGLVRVVVERSDTEKVTLYSHDWCDKTTWTTEATRVVDETATDSGDHTSYTLAHANVIDVYHGKITSEDRIRDASGNSMRVIVKVDGVTKTEQDPHAGSGGHYTINYATGTIQFLAAQTAEAVITATYHYANGSKFEIVPAAGKSLSIEFVEVQFSEDIEVTDSVNFQAYGYVIAFAPHLAVSNGGPYPDLTQIPLGAPLTYKGMRDFVNDAVRAYVKYPAMGGAGWRGLSQPVYVFDWDYARATTLKSSMGMKIVVSLEHNAVFGGEMATATFYCASESEPTE